MNRFSIDGHCSGIYDYSFSASGRQPIIGITGNYGDQTCKLGEGYYKQIIRAGGTPLVIPPSADKEVLLSTLNRIDALLLTGGADINPLYQNEEPKAQLGGINDERDLPELLITRLAYNRQMPILGICRGIQTLAVALGGRVAQHIDTDLKHSQEAGRSVPTHSVSLEQGSTLFHIFNEYGPFMPVDPPYPERLAVNSFHHQAVRSYREY